MQIAGLPASLPIEDLVVQLHVRMTPPILAGHSLSQGNLLLPQRSKREKKTRDLATLVSSPSFFRS